VAYSEVGFAIGNGTSRRHFNIKNLREHGLIVGCNWLFREYPPDILVSIDKGPHDSISEIPEDKRGFKWLTYPEPRGETRRSLRIKQNLILDGEPVMEFKDILRDTGRSHNSGIIACSYLAKVVKVKRLYMIGFDFFRVHEGMKQNDIYHHTVLRRRDFEKLFVLLSKDCPQTEFIRVGMIHPHDVPIFKEMRSQIRFMDFLTFEVLRETNRL